MNRTRVLSYLLAAALLPTTAVLAQTPPARGETPPTRPSGGDRGEGGRAPSGPGLGQSGSGAAGGAKRKDDGSRNAQRGESVETTAWLKAVDEISKQLTPEQQSKIKGIRTEWTTTNTKWLGESGPKLKELQQKLIETRQSGGKTDPNLLKQIQALAASRPKFDTYKTQITDLLTPAQVDAHTTAFAAEMKRVAPKGAGQGAGGTGGAGESREGRGGRGGREGRGGGTRDGGTPPTRGGGGTRDGGTPPTRGGQDRPAAPPTGR